MIGEGTPWKRKQMVAAAAAAKSLQLGRPQAWAAPLEEAVPTNPAVAVQLLSRVRLCDPMGCSTPGSVGLSRQEDLEWVSVSFSRGSSWIRDRTCVSCIGRWILYHRCPPIFRHAVRTQVLNRSRVGPKSVSISGWCR